MKKSVIAAVVLCLTMVLAQGISFGAVANDEITSIKIKEATVGSTSQDTNSGNGIKTGHLADAAITTVKIAKGAITADKLGIVCPTGQYLQFTTANGWACNVGTPGLPGPQGVKGDTGLTGPQGVKGDTGATGPQGVAGLQGDKGDTGATGQVGPQGPAANYAGVKIVHTGPADGVNTFSSISAAIQAIGPNNPAGRFAVVIMPGVYSENFTFLNTWNVQYNIDLIGQSRTGTIIQPQGNPWRDWDPNWKSCIRLADGMFFKNLTVRGTVEISSSVGVGLIDCIIDIASAAGGYGFGIASHYPQKVTLDNVEIISDGLAMWLYNWQDVENFVINNVRIKLTTPTAGGIWVFPSRTDAPVKFKNLTISGPSGAYGIQFFSYVSGTVEFDNLTINGQIPAFSSGGQGTVSVNVRNSSLNSTASLIDNNAGSPTLDFTLDHSTIYNTVATSQSQIKIGNSKVIGPIQGGSGLVTVVNSYNGAYQPIPNGSY